MCLNCFKTRPTLSDKLGVYCNETCKTSRKELLSTQEANKMKWNQLLKERASKEVLEFLILNISNTSYLSSGEREQIVFKGRVRGRTDIVILKESHRGGEITRHMVDFVIEIKDTSSISSNIKGCIRESVCQLLGLCGDNSNTSPSVVLTDLVKKFYVIYLTKSEAPLKFKILIDACEDLSSAIELAQMVAQECISIDFGRPPTPNLSDDE